MVNDVLIINQSVPFSFSFNIHSITIDHSDPHILFLLRNVISLLEQVNVQIIQLHHIDVILERSPQKKWVSIPFSPSASNINL